jgi:hypothetical protein
MGLCRGCVSVLANCVVIRMCRGSLLWIERCDLLCVLRDQIFGWLLGCAEEGPAVADFLTGMG